MSRNKTLRDASRKQVQMINMLATFGCGARQLSRHPTNYEQTKLKRRIDMISRLIITVAIALFFTPAALIVAQEHPEHPKKTTEHPKKGAVHPKKGGAEKQVSTADISAGIKKNIDAESKKSADSKFHVNYQGQDLALDLVRVHDDRLSDLGGGRYFACVDMKATDGKTYDIDFFLTGQPGKMKVTETSVHKIDGKPLYDWKEENGTWHKVPAS
ncbi:MAG: hypothetical protein DMF41_09830 [Verrucomicrobia bacterium]|nr:MAG: hypothetical protein DMF41_09830 [Verrucomicrobiota bacterium]